MTEQEWLESSDPQQMLRSLPDGVSLRKLRLFAVACCRRYLPHMRDKRSREAVLVAEMYTEGGITDQQLGEAAGPAVDVVRSIDARVRRVLTGEGDSTDCQLDPDWSAAFLAYAAAAPSNERAFVRGMSGLVRSSVSLCYALDDSGRDRQELADEEDRRLATLLREVVGNPFRPFSLPPAFHLRCDDCQGKGWIRQAGQYLANECRACAGRGYLLRASGWLAWNDGAVCRIADGIWGDGGFQRLPILADALVDAGCDNEELIAHCRSAGPHVRGCWVVDHILEKS
jgi:hypothetical protein